MKVTLVYPFFHRLGGIEKYLLDTLPHLKNRYDMTLMGSRFDPDVASEYRTMAIPVVTRPSFLTAISFSIAAQFALHRNARVSDAPEIIHVQGASAFRQDIVTAHSCHKAWFLKSLKEQVPFTWPWVRKILNPVHYFTMLVETIQYRAGNYRRVIAISNCIKQELIACYGVDPAKIPVIHSGVDCSLYAPSSNTETGREIRTRHGIPHDALVLLLVANEFRRKGLAVILDAMTQLTRVAQGLNLHLIVAGWDDPQPFVVRVSRAGLTGRVHFTGPVRGIHDYYAAADIFVLPTSYEPFGLVITEAMASGLPVVVSRLAGAAELMTDGSDSILLDDPRSPDELAAGIARLMDPDIRRGMGANARTTALANQWPAVVAKMAKVYEEVLAEKSGKQAH